MADLFEKNDIAKLFANKFIIMLGDSNMRSIYKDLVYLFTDGRMTPATFFRGRHDYPFCGDKLLKVAKPSQGRGYSEIREFEDSSNSTLIRYQLITRVYGTEVQELCAELETGETQMPQVLIINSCMWDLTRWGSYQEENYKNNIIKLFHRLKKILHDDTLVIWTTTPPVSSDHVKGGVFIKQIEFTKASMRFVFMEANSFVTQLCVAFEYDILDLHYWMRFQLNRRTVDGIHWEPHALRFITNLLLTHISLAFEMPLPNKCTNRSLDNSKKKATEGLKGWKVDLNLNKEIMEEIFNPTDKNKKDSKKKLKKQQEEMEGALERVSIYSHERSSPSLNNVNDKSNIGQRKKEDNVKVPFPSERVSLRARRRLDNSKVPRSSVESRTEKQREISKGKIDNIAHVKEKLMNNKDKANQKEMENDKYTFENTVSRDMRVKPETLRQVQTQDFSWRRKETEQGYKSISQKQSSNFSSHQQTSRNFNSDREYQNNSRDSKNRYNEDSKFGHCRGRGEEYERKTYSSKSRNLKDSAEFCEDGESHFEQQSSTSMSHKTNHSAQHSFSGNYGTDQYRKPKMSTESKNVEHYEYFTSNYHYNFQESKVDYTANQNRFESENFVNKTMEPSTSNRINYTTDCNAHANYSMNFPYKQSDFSSTSQLNSQATYNSSHCTIPQNVSWEMSNNSQLNIPQATYNSSHCTIPQNVSWEMSNNSQMNIPTIVSNNSYPHSYGAPSDNYDLSNIPMFSQQNSYWQKNAQNVWSKGRN